MKTHKKGRALKITLITIASLVILIAAMVGGGMAVMKHEYGDRTEVLKSTSAQTEKALVVYQPSLTEASHDVAYSIARGLNDSGYEVTITNPGKHLSTDISKYGIIVFGSPNYGGSVAEPLSEYIRRIDDFTGKRVILFSTSGGTDIMPELEKTAALLHGTKPYSMVKYPFTEGEKNKAAAYQTGVEAARQDK